MSFHLGKTNKISRSVGEVSAGVEIEGVVNAHSARLVADGRLQSINPPLIFGQGTQIAIIKDHRFGGDLYGNSRQQTAKSSPYAAFVLHLNPLEHFANALDLFQGTLSSSGNIFPSNSFRKNFADEFALFSANIAIACGKVLKKPASGEATLRKEITAFAIHA